MSQQGVKETYVQLSKPFFTLQEIEFIERNNIDLYQNLRDFKSKTKATFQTLISLAIKLNLPVKVLQNSSYYYQKFYLLNNNYKKYSSLHFEVGLSVLFISLKLNDFIKKVNVVISEAFELKGMRLSSSEIEENKKIIISLERKILEFQSFDFRNFLVEDFLIKYLKHFNKISPNKFFSYLCWSVLNDLYLTSLVLQFPAHYNAIISIKACKVIYNTLIEEKAIPGTELPVEWDLRPLVAHLKDISFILSGCDQILSYYIDNINSTFIKSSLDEMSIKIEGKKFVDILINAKIDINKNSQPAVVHEIVEDDVFYRVRDTDIAKSGAIRFLYNRQRFNNEVKMYRS